MIATADWTAWTCRVRVAVTDPAALDEARELVGRPAWPTSTWPPAGSGRTPSSPRVDRAGGAWTPISPLFTELLAVALRAARLTDGDVDPTVGAALSGLGYDRDVAEITADGVVVAVPAPGWRTIELDEEACRVRLAPGVRLDLGATAKAWTADTAAGAVTAATGSGCLVSIGGDIAVAGPAPDGGWRIRVEDVTGDPDAAPPARPPSSPSRTAAWPPPRSAPGAGSATGSGCTT